MRKTVAVITEKGRTTTGAFISVEHALANLDPFHKCIVRDAVTSYFKLHPKCVARSAEETLAEIGNVAGRPETHYASLRTRYEQASAKLTEIASLVQQHLGGVLRTPDPDYFRGNPSMFEMLDNVRRNGYYRQS